jgi:ribulose-5-phosphate 4-epimerase/fuculose-1-phosphate aldolase
LHLALTLVCLPGAARQDLAASYRFFAAQGWTELTYQHITCVVSAAEEGATEDPNVLVYLVNPYGLVLITL